MRRHGVRHVWVIAALLFAHATLALGAAHRPHHVRTRQPNMAAGSGVAEGWSAESPLQACAEAKHKAHSDPCPYLAHDKSVDACKCNVAAGGYRCTVKHRAHCRSLHPFLPSYAQTGTAHATSITSRSMACRSAKIHARNFVCRADRLAQKVGKCVCDAHSKGWDCMVDFTLWCQ